MSASVEFLLGGESVTVPLNIQVGANETILTGDIGGLVAAGTTARLRGNCRLTADLHVRGRLVSDVDAQLDGQGQFDIHTHDGGILDLQGIEKSAWVRWGDTPVGWDVGDRLVVAQMIRGVIAPSETTWQGSWAATTRPPNSPDVTIIDGSVMRPEVANLSQSLVLKNLTRIMLHESTVPNVHTLKWLKVLNSGLPDQLDFYPIHFHELVDTCRGSLLEGVVVEGGKNHAFVPHSSHGITLRDCVGFNTRGSVYWWNDGDRTFDLTFDHCLALQASSDASNHVTGFNLAAGTGSLVDCAAAGVRGGVPASSGFQWPSFVGGWPSVGLVAHNNLQTGIYLWNNTPALREGSDWKVFANSIYGMQMGAYQQQWAVTDFVASGNVSPAVESADLVWRAVPFSTAPAPRIIGGRVGSVLQGHHNVSAAANGLEPALLIDVEMDSFRVRDTTGMWMDFVRCLKNGDDLEPSDIEIVQAHSSCRWRGQRRDGTAWQKLPNGTVTAIPPFWE